MVEGMERRRRREARLRRVLTLLVLLVWASPVPLVAAADPLAWLEAQAQVDGSIATAGDVALAIQATSEALRTFHALGEGARPAVAAARQFLDAAPGGGTEALARRIIARVEAGGEVGPLIESLRSRQNGDGGFGALAGFESTPLDTAHVLEALAVAGLRDVPMVEGAIAFLTGHQGGDGGFTVDAPTPSAVAVTALCSIALQPYRLSYPVAATVDAATDFLLAHQGAGGGWQSDWETALSLLAVVPAILDATRYASSVAALRAGQGVDGSWGGDVYATALALRALHLADTVTLPLDPSAGRVSGRVVDGVTGLPVAAARVTVEGDAGVTTVTGPGGGFSLDAVAPGGHTLRIQAPGYGEETRTVVVVAGGLVDLGGVGLSPLSDVGRISGRVTGATTGAPLAGAVVRVSGASTLTVTTDSRGAFALASAPGPVSITAEAAGFEPATVSATVVAGVPLRFAPALYPAGSTPADPAVTITGTVVDGVSDAPLEGASVTVVATALTAATGPDGGFTLPGVTAGGLTVEVAAAGHGTVRYAAVAPAGTALSLGRVYLPPVVEPAATTVVGGVTEAETGTPVAGAEVTIGQLGLGAATGAGGRYCIEGVAARRFTVTARAAGYLSAMAEVSLAGPGRVTVDLALRRAAAAGLAIAAVRATQTVYPALTSVPLEVVLENHGTTPRTVRLHLEAVDGAGSIVGASPALTIPPGGGPATASVTVEAGASTTTTVAWSTGRRPAGTYRLVVQALDAASGRLLAERSLAITVEATRRIGGHATLDPPITQLAAHAPVHLTATLTNRGNEAIPASTVTATVSLKAAGYTPRSDLVTVEELISGKGLSAPLGMDMDGAGNLYVANGGANTVSKITPDGTVSLFAEGLVAPTDVDVDAQGNVYVLNRYHSFVRIGVDGSRTEVATGLTSNQEGIEALDDGRVFIAAGNALQQVDPDGTVTPLISGGLDRPEGMVADRQGVVFIADRGEDSIARLEGGVLSRFASGIRQPCGMAIDAGDNLYVAASGAGSVVKVTPDGTVTTVATGLSGPYGVALAPDGRLLVTNRTANEVVAITPAGDISLLAGPTIFQPVAALYDRAGDLYVGSAGSQEIRLRHVDGTWAPFATGVSTPRSLHLAADGGLDLLEANSRLIHLAPDGTRTTLASGLSSPHAMVPAPDGDGFLVTETGDNRIVRVDAAGQVVPYLAPALARPRAVRDTTSGDLVVADAAGRLVRIGVAGTTTLVADGLGSGLRGLAVDPAGNLYTTELNRREVLRIDPTGNVEVVATTPFSPGAVAITPQGELLVAPMGGTTVYTVEAAGTLGVYAQLGARVYDDMVVDAMGALWSVNRYANTVARRTSDGREILYPVAASPRGLQLDGEGGVYVAAQGEVDHIDATGRVSEVVAGGALAGRSLVGVATESTGDRWAVSDQGMVFRYRPDASLERVFAPLSSPKGMAVAGDGVLIVANGNGTVVRVAGGGRLPEVVAWGSYTEVVAGGASTLLLASANGVDRLEEASGAITALALGFGNVATVAVAPDGGFVVGDRGRNELIFYDAAGVEVDHHRGLVHPQGILVDGGGRILVANGDPAEISVVGADGRVEPFAAVSQVRHMALEADGSILASRGSQIVILDAGGAVTTTLAASDASGLTRDATGALLAASLTQGEVVRFEADGSSRVVAAGLTRALDVESDGSGNLYVADNGAGLVQAVAPGGDLSLVAGDLPSLWAITTSPAGDLVVSYSTGRFARLDLHGGRTELSAASVVRRATKGLTVAGDGSLLASVESDDTILRLTPTAPANPLRAGDTLYTATAQLPPLSLDGETATVSFGSWTPTVAGDYEVQVALDGATTGRVTNTLHVGATATATLDLDRTRVFPGDRTVHATLRITGGDDTAVTRVDGAGTILTARSGAQGRAIGADHRGNIYAADTNRIVRITPGGSVSDFVTGISVGNGLAVDSADNLYAVGRKGSGNEREVMQITPSGEVATLAVLPGAATGVAVDTHDHLYAVDTTGQLSRLHPDGTVEAIPVLGLSSPEGLTIDAYGNIYVLNRDSTVVRVTPDGGSSRYLDQAAFELEGVDMTADCANNLLFAPMRLLPFKPLGGEEDLLLQLVGDTGEVRQVLYGPDLDPALGDIDVLFYDRFAHRLLIWTDLNDGKIFSLPVVCGSIDVEAHVITRGDVDLVSTDPPPATLVHRGDGTVEGVWALSDVDARGRAIGLDLLFHDLTEGERRPALQEAFLTLSNSFDPAAPVRVPIAIPDLLASSAMGVAVALDAPEYGPDAPVSIDVAVTNDSDLPFDGILELSVVDGSGVSVAELPPIPIAGLAGLTTDRYTATWETRTTYAGEYTLVARLANTGGNQVAHGEASLRILAGGATRATLAASIHSDRPRYGPWGSVTLSGRVSNLAINAVQEPSTAVVTVTGPDGAVVESATMPVAVLYPSSHTQVGHTLQLVDAPAGSYTVRLEVRDGATATSLAEGETSFQVERTATEGLTGRVEVALSQVAAGEVDLCTDTVTNHSSAPLAGLTLDHLLASLATGTILDQTSERVALAGNGTLTAARSVATAGLAPGGYACLLRAATGGTPVALGGAAFQVTAPPVAVEGEVGLGHRGRLLVLLDGGLAGTAPPCSGLSELTLSTTFDPPLESTATALVELYDRRGVLADSESVALASRHGRDDDDDGGDGGHGHHEGEHDHGKGGHHHRSGDLQVRDFTATTLTLHLQGGEEGEGLGSELQVVVTLWNDGDTLHRASAPIDTSCDPPLTVGEAEGDFQVAGLQLLEAEAAVTGDADPGGPAGAPPRNSQATFLEQLLQEGGWSYTLTKTGRDFARALRTGGYTQYLLLTEGEELGGRIAGELREAVHLGAGLVVAGGGEETAEHLTPVLGLELEEGLAFSATGLRLAASTLHPPAETPLPLPEPHPAVEDRTALTLATFTGSGAPDAHPAAITTHGYGSGRALFMDFDLLAEAAAAGEGSLLADLLTAALAHVAPDPQVVAWGVVPVAVTLTNEGVPTVAQASVTLPAGVEVVDGGGGRIQADGSLLFTFDLGAGESATATTWIRLPDTAGEVHIEAALTAGSPPAEHDQGVVALDLAVQPPPTLSDAIARLTPLAEGDQGPRGYRKALEELHKAQRVLDGGRTDRALKALLKATERLAHMSEPDAEAVRTTLDYVIRGLERRLP